MGKFFEYNQNNSGGHFDFTDRVSHFVFIEADSAEQADERAQDWAGIYFDGCDKGMDCPCCGDRWYANSNEYGGWRDAQGDDEPMCYGEPAGNHDDMWVDYYIVYYAKDDGRPTKIPYGFTGTTAEEVDPPQIEG